MNSSIYCSFKNISNTYTTQPYSIKNNQSMDNSYWIEKYLDFARPAFESPSTSNLDKCKQRQESDAACSVRINDDICTTYSHKSDSASKPV